MVTLLSDKGVPSEAKVLPNRPAGYAAATFSEDDDSISDGQPDEDSEDDSSDKESGKGSKGEKDDGGEEYSAY